MRPLLLAVASAGLLAAATFQGSPARQGDVPVRVRLVNADDGGPVGGMIRVRAAGTDKPLALPGLLDRMRGLDRSEVRAGWYVVPVAGAATTLPRQRLRIEAVHGLESAAVTQQVDLTRSAPDELTIKLPLLFRPDKHGLVAGNTHLHLMKLTREDADEYLRTNPAADGLQVLFISYLERHEDDRTYITNRYPVGDLGEMGGTLVSNGEEHRHNFEGYGQGYGHVMLLGIKRLVRPVSIGPGIMKSGDDDRPLRPGIDEARGQGGTVIWCHNTYGHEDVPNMLAGRLDALNVFDGSRRDRYEDTYYRFLNIGLRVPISTGTDWFLYDFARVYAPVRGKVTPAAWLNAVKAGRTVATNGPLLTLTVDDRPVGDTLDLAAPRAVRVEATAIGRHDFQKLQLVRNGVVIQSESSRGDSGGFTARLSRLLRVDEPCWLAVRVETTTKNEFDQQLFAHSSPVYVDLGGRRVFDVEAARALLRMVEEAKADIRARGKFSADVARERLLTIYDQAADDLRQRINKRGN